MRGLAALLVITDHIPSGLADVFLGRAMAVDFFFVLSGFVLAHAYADRLNAGMSAFAFMRSRLIRLYPFYIVGTALGAIPIIVNVLTGAWHPSAGQFAIVGMFAMTFIPCPPFTGWTGNLLYPFVPPAWSLFFELVANLAFALIAPLRRVGVLAVWLPVAAVALVAANFVHGSFDMGWEYGAWYGGATRIAFGFFMGVLLYQVWRRGSSFTIPVWLAFPAFLLVTACQNLFPGQWGVVYSSLIQLVVIPVMVLGAANAKVSGRAAATCAFLGAQSYGVYLLHEPMIGLAKYLPGDPLTNAPILFTLGIALTALAAATILYRVYDVPLRTQLSRLSKRVFRPSVRERAAGG